MNVKTKMEKGITLIALIITIVVLLILAAVTITSITKTDLINQATTAGNAWNNAQTKENTILGEYESQIGSLIGGTSGGVHGPLGDATVGTIVTTLSTINGQAYSSTNPVIPKGFKAINTTTSSWDATDLATEVKKGLVISDGTSEFVWIPVENVSSMATVSGGTDANGRTNYNGSAEPAEVKPWGDTKFDSQYLSIWTETLYQETFNKMIESVAEYKGFYVGRYETSLNGQVGVSVSGASVMKNKSWHCAYAKSMSYAASNSNLGVVSELIWNCQWNAMLNFIKSGPDAEHATSTSFANYTTNVILKTGSTSTDVAANIYDLEGNVLEWTQAAGGGYARVVRGGRIHHPQSASGAQWCSAAQTFHGIGSRMTLYIGTVEEEYRNMNDYTNVRS